jgi:hypothetical protein
MVSMACYNAISAGVDAGKMAKNAIYISFLAAIGQIFISIDIFSFLLEARSTESRGYSSLYTEPSFFGLATLMFCIIYIAPNKEPEKKISWLPLAIALTSIVALSQSSLAILILLTAILLYLGVNLSIKNTFLLSAIVFSVVVAGLLVVEESDSRVLNVMSLFFKNPQQILLIDASISERAMHLYLSFKGAADNFLMPNGFYKFHDLMVAEMAVNEYFWWGWPSNKIMSGIGSGIYEIGFVSLITPVVLIILSIENRYSRGLLVLVGLTPILIYLNAINYASPYLSILIGVLACRLKKNDKGLSKGGNISASQLLKI